MMDKIDEIKTQLKTFMNAYCPADFKSCCSIVDRLIEDVRYLIAESELMCAELLQKTQELEQYKKAEEQGRLVVLPCKVGDKMFSFCWNIKSEKYEVHSGEIKNVRYNTADGSIMVSDGELFHVWGKTAFITRLEAESALEGGGGDE